MYLAANQRGPGWYYWYGSGIGVGTGLVTGDVMLGDPEAAGKHREPF